MKHSLVAWIATGLLIMPFFVNGHAAANAPAPWIDYRVERDQVDLNSLKDRLRFTTVTPAMIEKAFTERATPHPRIVADKSDFERLRRALAAKDSYVVSSVEALKEKGEAYLQDPLIPYELDAANLRLKAPHRRQDHIVVLSLLYQLTRNTIYADKVKEHLLHFAAFPDWNDGKHFLDTGIMSYVMALGYDWIYEQLTPGERVIIRDALVEKGIKPYLQRTENQPPFWYQSPNNWNPICNGGVSLAAMAVMDESKTMRTMGVKVLTRALKAAPFYIREFEPDGQTVEGLMYWGYGLSNFIRWMETMKRSLGTDFGYTEQPGLRAAGEFPLAVSGPVCGISLGDDPVLAIRRNQTNYWFAKRYQHASLARYHRDELDFYQDFKWFDLLYYDPTLLQSAGSGSGLPLDRYIRDLEYISFRSSWKHDEALYVGVHGGDNRASHGHLDAGTFFVQGGGQIWAIGGLGSDDYTFPGYFNSKTLPGYWDAPEPITQAGRFHMYRLRAEGKNTLVFNPDVRPDQNPEGRATVERILTSPDDAIAILNLSGVYDRDARLVRRGVGLRQDRQVVVIQDEFQTKIPSMVWWSMHTLASAELLQNGRVAVLKQGGKKLWVEIQAPSNAVFARMDSTYLPGQSFPLSLNSPNVVEGFAIQKLTIALHDVTEQTLIVSMKLINDNEASPGLPGTMPLDLWSRSIASP
jgi:hypothetical protein